MLTELAPKKILFVGLDNGGKTSIVQSLKGMKNITKFSNIPPTKGKDLVQIKKLDSEFSIWDLGGQETFRDEYLKNFDEYIFGCSKLIYVFDIQDIKRYELALQYFEKIIDLTVEKKKNKNIELSVFLHKFDPDLTRSDELDEKINSLKDMVKEKLDKTKLFYKIFETTIYTIFEKKVIDSSSLNHLII